MCLGGFWSRFVFWIPFFWQFYHSSLLFLLFLSTFVLSFHSCCFTSLTSLFVWPRKRSNHRVPRFLIVFLMFCFFLFTSMLTPHNNLALSNWNKERRKECEKQKNEKSPNCVALWSTSSATGVCLMINLSYFALLFLIYIPVLFLLFLFVIVLFSSCCCPSTFELCLICLTWVDWLNTTWLSEIENSENKMLMKDQKGKDKTKKDFGKNICCSWGGEGLYWVLTYKLFVSCVLFSFGGAGGGVPVSVCIPCCKSTPPQKKKTKQGVFQWFLLLLFCFCRGVFCNPTRNQAPQRTNKRKKKKEKGYIAAGPEKR